MSFEVTINDFKLVIHRNETGVEYEGYGSRGRKYAICRVGDGFMASMLNEAGEKHIAARGKTPIEALDRAESDQRWHAVRAD